MNTTKQDAGFNHKEFGVTSEGVVVYLDVALRKALKIDPKKDPFSIKLTGGPDGDGTCTCIHTYILATSTYSDRIIYQMSMC